MRRYWLEPQNFSENEVTISGDTFHHIFDVCRMNIGDKFEVLGHKDRAWVVEVVEIKKKLAIAKKIDERDLPTIANPRLILCLAISRYHVMDSVIERAVEMGISEIRPFVSEHSFIRQIKNLPSGKIERWRKIVVSATQQCGRAQLMPILSPLSLNELLAEFVNRKTHAKGLFAYEGEGTLTMSKFTQELNDQTDEIWLFVGSEGGFSNAEVRQIQDFGLKPLSLGDQVLRVETACITLIAILKYAVGLLS